MSSPRNRNHHSKKYMHYWKGLYRICIENRKLEMIIKSTYAGIKRTKPCSWCTRCAVSRSRAGTGGTVGIAGQTFIRIEEKAIVT